ncbi:UDP-N-acetylmuramate--L-alanine ligase [Francisella tularensis]|uniref:UDP-N-acetylmuramate--L-alanine ligase n=1 Tax=Francisella tularensis subsp. tularensis (strain WY96-3418) TaxID=418136 RepID=MURC_FRATW|nr:UDP-N-acetylmuramate--L-alanine ligase [Francisella tularensis]A4J011.1 RecName: Full=UDP-N-acetylmuramate--L-alanine ligase; AltName: Full=UDP-N-acetylmuramoyl-L-alanine synthetase [Francisella tularensis subsp. tularensis WY96-3418]ABO47512.1 UDP-N-acetylmuramate--alanine ligase [Francisella tularensis subsp. tularensis WY96-3418]AJI62929.1 UDP-N-acetylmuramate--L-alanine ligase [Francisella tularensis subsp. tularensis]AJI63695.1 UDP-N-acetylmuramate--L-alanine ligase [Francisella tularen
MNKKILFLGVGGIGVSALAIAAKRLGAHVAGYDSVANKLTAKLEALGIVIFTSPNGVDVANFDIVVYSSAILSSHPLLSQARSLGIQCLQRAMFLAVLMKDFSYSIAITGTHGKTTTSSVLATLLCQLDKYSSFIVGGVVKYADSNIQVNGTDKLVIEADESDASFLFLSPQVVIITNIDLDHMATYNNSYQTLLENFTDFVSKESVKSIYLCVDDQGCRDLLAKYNQSDKNVTSYGFSINADVQIYDYHIIDEITHFKIRYKGDDLSFKLQLPGRYNVQNATACIIACLDLGFKYEDIRNALIKVTGVARRFDLYTKVISGHQVTVIDDYGHHPVEVANSISAVRDRYPNKKIIHVFQPHRYTRNRDLIKDWPKALSLADQLILLPTYSADEQIIKGAESQDIVKGLSGYLLADGFDHAIYFLEKLANENTVILIQGAGDVTNLVEILSE